MQFHVNLASKPSNKIEFLKGKTVSFWLVSASARSRGTGAGAARGQLSAQGSVANVGFAAGFTHDARVCVCVCGCVCVSARLRECFHFVGLVWGTNRKTWEDCQEKIISQSHLCGALDHPKVRIE